MSTSLVNLDNYTTMWIVFAWRCSCNVRTQSSISQAQSLLYVYFYGTEAEYSSSSRVAASSDGKKGWAVKWKTLLFLATLMCMCICEDSLFVFLSPPVLCCIYTLPFTSIYFLSLYSIYMEEPNCTCIYSTSAHTHTYTSCRNQNWCSILHTRRIV